MKKLYFALMAMLVAVAANADDFTVAIAGAFNNWSATANTSSEVVDNCVRITIPNWTNTKDGQDDGFKIVVNGKWYSNNNEDVPTNGSWQSGVVENGEKNMKLNSYANGKDVVFVFAVDNYNFSVNAYPNIYFAGSQTDWADRKLQFNTTDHVNYTLNLEEGITPSWKIICGDSWCGTGNGELTFGKAYAVSVGGGDNFQFESKGLNTQIVYNLPNNTITVTVIPSATTVKLGFTKPSEWTACYIYYSLDNGATWTPIAMTMYVPQPKNNVRVLDGEGEESEPVVSNTYTADVPDNATNVFFANEGDLTAPAPGTNVFGKDKITNDAKFDINGDVTGVEVVEVESAAAVYYNLQGQRVENPANGIFIKVAGNKAVKVIR